MTHNIGQFICSSLVVYYLKTSINEYLISFSSLKILYVLSLDIDECLTNPCHYNASCTDNEGSFNCVCNAGYSGNGFNCSSK